MRSRISVRDLEGMLSDLIRLFSAREPIGPRYVFPDQAIDWTAFHDKANKLRSDIRAGVNSTHTLRYQAPWTSPRIIPESSLDLVFSEGVLQCIDDLEGAYRAMFGWLKPGGFSSHAVGLSGAYLSPYWNGHWAYSDWQWRLVRGGRPFLSEPRTAQCTSSLCRTGGLRRAVGCAPVLHRRPRCWCSRSAIPGADAGRPADEPGDADPAEAFRLKYLVIVFRDDGRECSRSRPAASRQW